MATSYVPKNILITGAAGFIASHVCNRLIQNYPDYKNVVLGKLDYCSNLKNLLPSTASPNFKFIKGDIASADLVNYILLTESIDTIMHFAVQTHVDNSFGNSFEFPKNNVYGTQVLLEACKTMGQIKRFIHVSTDEVYGETKEDAVAGNQEASQLLPTNSYSATKAGAEMLIMAYGRFYGLPVITTRGNNVYGPNQFPEKLIPKFILLAMKGNPLPIHGDGSNVRNYLYCEDSPIFIFNLLVQNQFKEGFQKFSPIVIFIYVLFFKGKKKGLIEGTKQGDGSRCCWCWFPVSVRFKLTTGFPDVTVVQAMEP